MTITYEDALTAHQIDIPAHLVAQAEIPVLTTLQLQGDLAIIPTSPSAKRGELVPSSGIQVVRGEASANTHWLDAAIGVVLWAPATAGGTDLGVVTVPDGGVAVLTHTDEHGANAIGSGTYLIRRQREQAEEIRIVAD
jgi:hypothetical protein